MLLFFVGVWAVMIMFVIFAYSEYIWLFDLSLFVCCQALAFSAAFQEPNAFGWMAMYVLFFISLIFVQNASDGIYKMLSQRKS